MIFDSTTIFEALMLICFGAAWPFSIWRLWKTKVSRGKSMYFLGIVLLGYLAGIIHKHLNCHDYVIYLYVFNAVLVAADMTLTLKYRNN
ncbi:MAG: hypothetical protein WAX69_21520 [Victivallales bacterium]